MSKKKGGSAPQSIGKAQNINQAVAAAGNRINKEELKKIEKKFGSSALAQVKEIVQEKPGVSFKSNAQQYYQKKKPAAVAAASNNDTSPIAQSSQEIYTQGTNLGGFSVPAGRYSEEEFGLLGAGILSQIQGDIEVEKQQAAGLATTKAAEIAAGAAKYGYDRDLEAKRYVADQDLLKGTRVAEIEGKNRLDLQGIINAGLKEIEETRGQSERTIARIGSEASFRNALIGAFNF